jgi:hypothetical protein
MQDNGRMARTPLFYGLLVALAAVAAVVGGYLDWLWWHPTQGIVITLAAIGLILLAGALALFRRPITGSAAMVALALGAGLLVGQTVGPARGLPQVSIGTMSLTLTEPIPAVATGPADCSSALSGDQLQVQVTQDVNTRLPLEGEPAERHPFVSAGFSSGDMWAPEFGRRADELVVSIYLNSSFEPADGPPTELWLHSDSTSQLTPTLSGNDGAVAFSGLVLTEGDLQSMIGAAGEVTGTLEWTCPGFDDFFLDR